MHRAARQRTAAPTTKAETSRKMAVAREHGAAGQLEQLQGIVGNRAVGRLLGSETTAAASRTGPGGPTRLAVPSPRAARPAGAGFPSAPPLQRRGEGGESPEFSGLETEFTWEKELTKRLTFRAQGEILYNPASPGPAKLSKGLLKITKKAGKGYSSAIAGRAATLDPLSTTFADDFFDILGLDAEGIRESMALEMKLFEIEVKKGSRIPSIALLKIELKLPRVDLTRALADLNPDFAAALAEAQAAGHELQVRGHLGLQWTVPMEELAKRNPYAAAFMVGAAAGLGITYLHVSAIMEGMGEAGGALGEAATAAEGISAGLVHAVDSYVYRPAFEVLLMADPANMDFDKEVSEDEIGVITDIAIGVQQAIWLSPEIGGALKSIEQPMSAFADRADMEEIAAAGRRIGAVDDSLLEPAAMLAMRPKAFFQLLWDAAILSWHDDPDVALEDVEAAFLRGDWRPSIAGGG